MPRGSAFQTERLLHWGHSWNPFLFHKPSRTNNTPYLRLIHQCEMLVWDALPPAKRCLPYFMPIRRCICNRKVGPREAQASKHEYYTHKDVSKPPGVRQTEQESARAAILVEILLQFSFLPGPTYRTYASFSFLFMYLSTGLQLRHGRTGSKLQRQTLLLTLI